MPKKIKTEIGAREAAEDMTTRSFQCRADSINLTDRSIEAVIATEEPVAVFDFRSYEIIDETLRMDGAKLPAQLPLLDTHSRYQTSDVLGSTRELRVQSSARGPVLVGRNYFSSLAEDAWTKVREGHLTDNSVGYRVLNYVDIPAGQTQDVKGHKYTAGQRALRVSTEWEPKENSLVPIGADAMAKMREEFRGQSAPAKQENAMSKAKTDETRALDDKVAPDEPVKQTADTKTPEPPVDLDKIRADAVSAEQARVRAIVAEGDGIDQELVRRTADDPKMDVNAARGVFLKHLRDNRSKPVGPGGQAQGDNRTEEIAAAVALTAGVREKAVAETIRSDIRERVMNEAMSGQMRGFGLHCLMDAVIAAGGKQYNGSRKSDGFVRAALEADELVRRTEFSTLSLSGILANVANKGLIDSYSAVEVVWPKICGVRSHSDFKVWTRYRLDSTGAFKKVAADGEIKHISMSDASYTTQLATFGAMLVLTRQMQINDDLGAFMQIPSLLGRLSALRVEEAVFVLLLSNPSSFFAAGNKNYVTGAATALSIASIAVAEKKFRDFVDSNGKPILVSPKTILTGTTLGPDAQNVFDEKVIIASSLGSTSSKVVEPARNKMYNKYPPVISPYVDNTNITDQDGAAITGQSATAWWMFADPMVRAAMSVAFLNGQQTPTIEFAQTEFSSLGMQWRGYHDFGVGMEEVTAAVLSAGV